jgi:hypothetical protein
MMRYVHLDSSTAAGVASQGQNWPLALRNASFMEVVRNVPETVDRGLAWVEEDGLALL